MTAMSTAESTSLEVTLSVGSLAAFQGSRKATTTAVAKLLGSPLSAHLVKSYLKDNETKLHVLVRTTNEEVLTSMNTVLATKGTVMRLGHEAHTKLVRDEAQYKASRDAQGSQVVGASSATSTIGQLLALAGTGGSSKKKRKMARQGMEVMHVGQVWAASSNKDIQKVNEASRVGSDDESDEAGA